MNTLKCIFLIMLISMSLNGFAQQVSYRKEIIYVDNKPYAILEKKGTSWAKEYSLKTLDKKELATIKPQSKQLGDGFDLVYYVVKFKGFPGEAEMQDDNDFARILANELGRIQVLKGNKSDPEAIQLFLEKYPVGKLSGKANLISKPLN